MSAVTEQPLTLTCDGQRMCGILHAPAEPAPRGVVMLVGGPQYRVGSHRQFVLTARALAADGICVLRFDHRGAGDSEGETRPFEDLADDLDCAVNALREAAPGVREVVVWGLCDAASAAALFAHRNEHVSGIVLINPWMTNDTTLARTYLRHYYPNRLVSPTLWAKVLRGRFQFVSALKSLGQTLLAAIGRPDGGAAAAGDRDEERSRGQCLQERMAARLHRFPGRILFILSGEDLTAREFQDVAGTDGDWQRLLAEARVTRHVLPGADHTFTVRSHLDTAAQWTSEWIREL